MTAANVRGVRYQYAGCGDFDKEGRSVEPDARQDLEVIDKLLQIRIFVSGALTD